MRMSAHKTDTLKAHKTDILNILMFSLFRLHSSLKLIGWSWPINNQRRHSDSGWQSLTWCVSDLNHIVLTLIPIVVLGTLTSKVVLLSLPSASWSNQLLTYDMM